MTCKPIQSWRDFQLECALRAAMLRAMDEKHRAKALDRAAEALQGMSEGPPAPSAREVLADFMLQGHLTYRDGQGRWSDYERADAMIRDLAAEGLMIVALPNGLKAPLSSESTTASKDVREKD